MVRSLSWRVSQNGGRDTVSIYQSLLLMVQQYALISLTGGSSCNPVSWETGGEGYASWTETLLRQAKKLALSWLSTTSESGNLLHKLFGYSCPMGESGTAVGLSMDAIVDGGRSVSFISSYPTSSKLTDFAIRRCHELLFQGCYTREWDFVHPRCALPPHFFFKKKTRKQKALGVAHAHPLV